jgi:3-deoxy-D-manno-octulosonate 8-phosphate phosphatase (KDO 8-P phosphatase)
VLQGQADKRAGWQQLLTETGLLADQCAFMGDDWADLPVLMQAGFAATVADADEEVCLVAHWIARSPGGRGAVRELARFILRAQGKYAAALLRQTQERANA